MRKSRYMVMYFVKEHCNILNERLVVVYSEMIKQLIKRT